MANKKKTKPIALKPPHLYKGEISVDDRGELGYINHLDLTKIKRFYTVKNHTIEVIRAWHGHLKEEKYIMPLSGAALVAFVAMKPSRTADNGYILYPTSPNKDYGTFALNSTVPQVLYIPAGFAHGIKFLTPDTRLMIWSTASIEESKNDDYRFNAGQFRDLFGVENR